MKDYLRWLLAVFLVALVASPAVLAAKPIAWKPDRGFAKVVKVGFEQANRTVTILEDVCLKPDLPQNTAVTAGVAEEDCMVIATRPAGFLCFELLWQNGNSTGSRYPCALVRKTLRHDVRPSWIVHYRVPFTA